jgi:hypothetical protein
MSKLFNLARMSTATTGTGTITLGSSVSGFLSFAAAGVQNGDTITYAIRDGANSEIGRGVYTASGTTLTRNVLKSTNSDAEINLSGGAEVFITAAAENVDSAHVKWFGAVGDGTTDDTAAVAAMASALGFVRFAAGNYRMTTATISVLASFDPGAYISVDSANTVTFATRVDSPQQWIFRGDGAVAFDGSDALDLDVSWFNIFPDFTNVASKMNAMIASVATETECRYHFDIGTYSVGSTITWGRASRVIGSGQRAATHFRAAFTTGAVFDTAGEGCQFENIQFSCTSTRTSDAYIKLSHNYGVAKDIWFTDGFVGIDCVDDSCSVENVTGFNWATGSGSCLVALRDGTFFEFARRIRFLGSNPPEYIVRIEGSQDFTIKDIDGDSGTALVAVVAAGASSALRGLIDGVHGASGTDAVRVSVSASVTAGHITIDHVFADASLTNGVAVTTTAGTARDIMIDGVQVENLSGAGVVLTRTAGVLDDVKIGGNCNLDRAASTITLTNTPTNVRVNPMARGNGAQLPVVYTVTIADDGVFSLDFGKGIFISFFSVACNNGAFGQWLARAATTPSMTAMLTASGITATTGVLTGTTGVDGEITVAAEDAGKYYVENRTGGSRPFLIQLGLNI